MHHGSGAGTREDDRLVDEFRCGTHAGLEAAYQAHGQALYAVACNVLGAADEAQDCVHDTLLRIWQRSRMYRPERGSLRSYLMVAVRNEALTRKRAAARHRSIELRAQREQSPSYELELSDSIERARLLRALDALPAEQKAALELAYFGQLTHVQVAERLQLPLGTAKSRIALALRKLNAAIAKGQS